VDYENNPRYRELLMVRSRRQKELTDLDRDISEYSAKVVSAPNIVVKVCLMGNIN